MTTHLRIGIAGRSILGPTPEIPWALDELIYRAVADALADAGMTVADVDGVCMAASDLNDGRAISTMTLTGSTGSLRKSELRVCNDSLAAVWVGAAEVASGSARALVVCTWSKLSDANTDAILPLALEPAFHRGLAFHPNAVVGLRESYDTATVTTVAEPATYPVDVAAAIVITAPDHRSAGSASIIGCGASSGAYMRPGRALLEPLATAAGQALERAGVSRAGLSAIIVPGLDAVSDAALCAALDAPAEVLKRLEPRGADLGYAAGLVAVHHGLGLRRTGRFLVVTGGGVGLENAHAVVVEVA